MKIKQITFNEALELAQSDKEVYVIKFTDAKNSTANIRKFRTLIIGDMMKNQDKYIFCIIEEA